MNRAFLEKNSNNIETPVQLLEFMKNFTQHPALVYRSAYTIFGTVTLWRFDALPATLESFKIWISDCTQRKVQLWPAIKNRPLLFSQTSWLGRQVLGANWKQDCKQAGVFVIYLALNIVSTLHCKCLQGIAGTLQGNQSAGISNLWGLQVYPQSL